VTNPSTVRSQRSETLSDAEAVASDLTAASVPFEIATVAVPVAVSDRCDCVVYTGPDARAIETLAGSFPGAPLICYLDFEALAASPYDTIEFQMQVHNDYVETEVAALVPDGLPWGSKLEVSPAEVHIKTGTNRIFNCKLSLDDSIIRPGCDNDSGFLLTIWRRAEDSDEKWGSCFYFIRPRYKTELLLGKGYWVNRRIALHGKWRLSTQENIDITGEFPLFVRIRLAIHTAGEDEIIWRTVQMDSNGNFSMNIERDLVANENSLTAQAWFDRTDLLGSSVSEPLVINRSVIE
jgi:hypothetical protein